jgi:hypothetical protein
VQDVEQGPEGGRPGVTAVLDALEAAMPAAAFLQGLVQLAAQGGPPVRRLALRLFTARIESLRDSTLPDQDVDSRY